ncbi:MAG: diacylglycerol kinase family protein [Bacteroidales bacterium]|nr:diacylglycerol kinase family protein [Bacteroidales bacterium]
MNYIKKRINSFRCAFQGISSLFKETPNFLIQLAGAIVALLMGLFFRISNVEWLILVLLIGCILSLEAINSALENLSDYACKKEIHPTIKKVKDLSAAAVLIMAMAALVVGVAIFLPRIVLLFE